MYLQPLHGYAQQHQSTARCGANRTICGSDASNKVVNHQLLMLWPLLLAAGAQRRSEGCQS
jgi:hypothetical protein